MTSVLPTLPRRFRRATQTRPAPIAALVVAIIVLFMAAPQAQQAPPAFASAAPGGAASVLTEAPTDVDLLVGRSTVLNVGAPISRVSLTVPDIADAMVTAPGQLLIHGKQPGTISLFVWDRAGAIKTFEVKVRRDLTPLVGHLKQLFPAETITVLGSGKDVVLSGTVSSKYVMEKAAEVAGGYVEKADNVVNLLKQQEGVASNQVMLRVRFAEVSRSALQELGASFVADGARSKWFGRTTTGQFPSPEWDQEGRLVFSDFLNLFVLNTKEGFGGVVRALQNRGLFQSLAEPNLIASSGKEASFLAGGEYPYPIAQPTSTGTSFTIMFKEFGVRLNFTPTVLGGDLIHIKVRPEVSALDFANAITLEGFRIPALTTRRTETEVELRDGQTFAIAGLMNNTLTNSMSKIPGIGDIPVLGLLFRSKAHQKNQSELVVMITPHIIRRGDPGVSEGLPSLLEPYLGTPDRSRPNPDAYIGSPRYPSNQSRSGADAVDHPAVHGTPAAQAPERSAPHAAVPVQPAGRSSLTISDGTTPPSAAVAPVTAAASPSKEELRELASRREAERKAAEKAAAAEAKAAEQQRKAQADAEKVRLQQEKREAETRAAQARADEKRRAEQAKKDEARRKQAEKLDEERRKREAEVARRNEEQARKRQEEAEQHQRKALSEAELRLKQAQDAYQRELSKSAGRDGGS